MKKSFGQIFEEVKTFGNNFSKVIFDKQYMYSNEQKEYIYKVLFEDKITPEHRYEVDHVDYYDYIKVYYKNGNWALIRFSGTEPILRIFVETDNQKENLQLVSDWEKLLKIEGQEVVKGDSFKVV